MVNRTRVFTCTECGVRLVFVVFFFSPLQHALINTLKKKKCFYCEMSFNNEQIKYLHILQEGFGLVSNIHS